jgi:hypothetical protein
MQVTIEIPDAFAAQLTADGKDPARLALEAIAIEGYRHRQLSEGAVCEMLSFENRLEFQAFLADNDVPFNYSIDDKPIAIKPAVSEPTVSR